MRTVAFSIICFVFCTTLALPASAKSAKDDFQVAYVNMARCLNEVTDGKKAKQKLKKEFEAKQKKLDEMQKSLKAKKEDFEKKQGMMKPAVRAQKQEELQRELMQLQQTYMQLQQELMGNESQITQKISEKIRKVIGKIGDREAYTLILDIGDGVLYHKRHQDLTDQVVREYNKEYGKK